MRSVIVEILELSLVLFDKYPHNYLNFGDIVNSCVGCNPSVCAFVSLDCKIASETSSNKEKTTKKEKYRLFDFTVTVS